MFLFSLQLVISIMKSGILNTLKAYKYSFDPLKYCYNTVEYLTHLKTKQIESRIPIYIDSKFKHRNPEKKYKEKH